MKQEQQQPFDASAALAAVRQARIERRRRCTWGKSRLTPHRAELAKLRTAGASFGDLVFWLRKEKRIKVADTTVMRFLAKLPELASAKDGEHA